MKLIFLNKDVELKKKKFMETLDYLILKFVDLNAKDENGLTPFHYACKCDHELGVKRLIYEKNIIIDVNNSKNLTEVKLHLTF